jgi:hypothetical protein
MDPSHAMMKMTLLLCGISAKDSQTQIKILEQISKKEYSTKYVSSTVLFKIIKKNKKSLRNSLAPGVKGDMTSKCHILSWMTFWNQKQRH